ncbi:MAG: class I SAM-dependent methyltransferase [Patescibacteria group bacterium]
MNEYIKYDSRGVEVGCGTGISKFYIKARNFILTDYLDNDWLDIKNVDALNTPFENKSFDFIVSSNMIHHVPYPLKFFQEMNRILRPGGVLLIQEINASFFMRLFLRLMRHEGYSFDVDVFNEEAVCTNPNDLWSANCAIPNLLFDNKNKFKQKIPYFKIISDKYCEFFIFLNSGGVIAKTFYIPLPIFLLRLIKLIDDILTIISPRIFALQRQIILQKI